MSALQKFNTPIDLNRLEIRNMRLQVLASAPTGFLEGMMYYDSAVKSPTFFDGTNHIPLDARLATNIPLTALAQNPLDRAQHTGTQLANTISNLAATVQAYRLNQFAAPNGHVAWGGYKITGLGTPTADTDAANKGYVDTAVAAAVGNGEAASAAKLTTARTFAMTGTVTAAAQSFDGTANITFTTTIADGALSVAKTAGLQGLLDGKQGALGYTPANLAGDTFTGPVYLIGDAPTDDAEAAHKGYVDAAAAAAKAQAIAAAAAGNAATATKLANARTFSISGVITASGVTFDGSGNVQLVSTIADGALTIAKVSGLQSAINAKQDALGYTPINKAGDTMLGALTLSGDPTQALHAATKQYVDNAVQNAQAGLDVKAEVMVVSTTNIALTGLQTIDGYAVKAGESVLVAGNTNGAQNGIYVAASGAWARRSDAVQDKLTAGALVLVMKGTNGGRQYYLQTDNPITVGTTVQTWVTFAVGKLYFAGDGLQGTDTFSVKPAAGVVVSPAGVGADFSVVSRKANFSFGDGTAKTFTLTHSFGTRDVTVSIRNAATQQVEYAAWTADTDNTVTVEFAGDAPAANAYRATVMG